MKATLEDIFAAIRRERQYQTAKWGSVQEHPHEVASYCVIMQGELDEAMQAWRKGRFGADDLREVLQVVAVGVACLEQHGVVEREELASLAPTAARSEPQAIKNQGAICCPWCGDLVGTIGATITHLVVKHKQENLRNTLTDSKLVDLVTLIMKEHTT